MLRTKMMMLVIGAASVLSVLATPTAEADTYSGRQYYSGWNHHSSYGYHYRYYYYKPSTSYYGYRHNYVIYYPSRPKYYYYYNPYTKHYWGRCPVDSKGRGEYSMLAEKDRRSSLDEIPEEAFPKPGKVPGIPEATDDATLDLPPDDLPPNGDAPVEKKADK